MTAKSQYKIKYKKKWIELFYYKNRILINIKYLRLKEEQYIKMSQNKYLFKEDYQGNILFQRTKKIYKRNLEILFIYNNELIINIEMIQFIFMHEILIYCIVVKYNIRAITIYSFYPFFENAVWDE